MKRGTCPERHPYFARPAERLQWTTNHGRGRPVLCFNHTTGQVVPV